MCDKWDWVEGEMVQTHLELFFFERGKRCTFFLVQCRSTCNLHLQAYSPCMLITLLQCNSEYMAGKLWVRVFQKNTFSKKKIRLALHVSLCFFCLDKSRRSHHLVKNEGFLHCRFSLGLLLAWSWEGWEKIYNVKTKTREVLGNPSPRHTSYLSLFWHYHILRPENFTLKSA